MDVFIKTEPLSPTEAPPSPNEESPVHFERRKSMAMRRKSSIALPGTLRRSSNSSYGRKSVMLDSIQLQDELQREMKDINRMEDALKIKWMNALETHKENFQLNLEKKKRDGVEMQRMKTLVEEVRAQRDQKKVMSVLANLEEKKDKVDEFKKRRVTIVAQAKKEELQKEESKRAWINMLRGIKSMHKEKKKELEEERKRQFSMTLERQNEIKEKLEQRKMEQRKSQVDWERRISVFKIKKKVEKKRYKKRLRPPTESENRFKWLQHEAKMRTLREEARKKQLEHERRIEKRKRYLQELARRAEARARLEHLRTRQRLADFRQSVAMDRVRKQYEAQVAVQKAEKIFTEKMVDMLKKNDQYLQRLRQKALSEKQLKEKAEKVAKEMERRAAVCERLQKQQERVQQLAEVKGRQLAEEEVAFRRAKEEQKQFNRWVSAQYHKKAVAAQDRRHLQALMRKHAARQQLQQKKEAELRRRQDTLRAIQFLSDNRARSVDESAFDSQAGEQMRREVIRVQQLQHRRALDQQLQRKIDEGEQIRRQLIHNRDLYVGQMVAESEMKRQRRMVIRRKADKMAWR